MKLQIPLKQLLISIFLIQAVICQCPWHRDIIELQSSCLCAYNLGQELSVQCDQVDFDKLLRALEEYAYGTTIDLLYVNNSTVSNLKNGSFEKLTMHNVQLSGCHLRNIEPEAFRGQENSLRNLNLQENDLTQVPIEALKGLEKLSLLDLSRNKITKIPDGAFSTLKLATLKLSDNNVSLAPFAFRGLENSLKNLNLKGTKQKRIPEAIRDLKTLAFLDLAANALRELPGPGVGVMDGLHSLTALNLERNIIQSVGPKSFSGINDSLSSLSLLNNLITDFPTEAMNSLIELRVLDIGFNLLTEIPNNAFLGNPSLTLLALDGNPLSTVPKESLIHLNNSLRGLSLGGRFLHCDCRLKWIAEWIRKGDLQVTSRERNPQFCGSPTHLKDRGFYSIEPKELVCGKEDNGLKQQGIAIIHKADLDDPIRPNPTVTNQKPQTQELDDLPGTGIVNGYVPPTDIRTPVKRPPVTHRPIPSRPSYNQWSTTHPPSTTWGSTKADFPPIEITRGAVTERSTPVPPVVTTQSSTTQPPTVSVRTTTTTTTTTTTPRPPPQPITTSTTMKITRRPQGGNKSTSSPWRNGQRPPLVMAYPPRTRPVDEDREVLVKNAYRQDNSVIIQWDSEVANILGFRVVYRLFGDKSFKQGPPLEASEREFKIKNVPTQECIVVCVISLEEVNISPEAVPYSQCREVRTVNSSSSNMDKITVAASAAICGTVVIAVVVFVVASKRRSRKLQTLQRSTKQGVSVSSFPVPCCTSFAASPSPGGPLSSLAALNAFSSQKDWDQVSVYSNRSIPRPQVYHIERQGSLNARCSTEDIRSHVSHASHFSTKPGKTPRSIADGQSQHSFSNSTRYLGGASAFNGLVSSRPELRQSRQSLASMTDRLSRMSYPATHTHQIPRHCSGSRQRSDVMGTRPASRYSTAGSTHTLNNYCDNSDNWTDHDMDIYLARNPTTRNGFVPL